MTYYREQAINLLLSKPKSVEEFTKADSDLADKAILQKEAEAEVRKEYKKVPMDPMWQKLVRQCGQS